jgi:GGDEF domain-containing protein
MIFSPKKGSDLQDSEPASSLFRVVQQILEACALHAVEFDPAEHTEFRSSIRGLARRFEELPDYKDLLILAGEANKTIQAYNHLVERFIRALSTEKRLAVELLSQSLLKVCRGSEKSTQALRQIEKELGAASQLQDMRELRGKLAECVASLCLEADVQDAQYRELKERTSQASPLLEARDQVTGLGLLRNAESRIQELAEAGSQGYVMAFFLKNVDVVNRRFGFASGDEVLRRFAEYLRKSFQGKDQLFRWRGPCFVVLAERSVSFDAVQGEARTIGIRGPEQEVESEGKSMLIRLIAATAAFAIPKGPSSSGLSSKIDRFAAEQFKISPPPR